MTNAQNTASEKPEKIQAPTPEEDLPQQTFWQKTQAFWQKTQAFWQKTQAFWQKTQTFWQKTQTLISDYKFLSFSVLTLLIVLTAGFAYRFLPPISLNLTLPWKKDSVIVLEVGGSRQNKKPQLKVESKSEQLSELMSTAPPSPSPTPKPLPSGKQVFNFSHGSDVKGPKLQKVIVDPLDPQLDQKINITANIKHDSPVAKASVILETDNKTQTQIMKLVDGENNDGTWQTSFTLNDTYLYNYYIKFDLKAENSNAENSNYEGGLKLRP